MSKTTGPFLTQALKSVISSKEFQVQVFFLLSLGLCSLYLERAAGQEMGGERRGDVQQRATG